jgi:hypothetical protein
VRPHQPRTSVRSSALRTLADGGSHSVVGCDLTSGREQEEAPASEGGGEPAGAGGDRREDEGKPLRRGLHKAAGGDEHAHFLAGRTAAEGHVDRPPEADALWCADRKDGEGPQGQAEGQDGGAEGACARPRAKARGRLRGRRAQEGGPCLSAWRGRLRGVPEGEGVPGAGARGAGAGDGDGAALRDGVGMRAAALQPLRRGVHGRGARGRGQREVRRVRGGHDGAAQVRVRPALPSHREAAAGARNPAAGVDAMGAGGGGRRQARARVRGTRQPGRPGGRPSQRRHTR